MNEFIQVFTLGGDGPTIAIKDTIDIAGWPTTAASHSLASAPRAAQHAEVVQLALDAGWQVVGKTNMHELAFGMTGINDYTGTATNPQDPTRIPGGSSSGSAAAVGAKLADAALGTDTGGSVRGPAACCGVIGLKPTFGRVSRKGVAPSVTTLDCVGPFARDMRTLTAVMTAIAPGFNGISTPPRAGTLKVGVLRVDACAEINDAVSVAPELAGFQVQQIVLDAMADAFDAGLAIINSETWNAFGHLVAGGGVGPDLVARLRSAADTTADQLAAAEHVRQVFTEQVDRALEQVDVIMLPTLPQLPVTIEAARRGEWSITMSAFIRPFNLSGHPALSLPLPIAGSPLLAGLQIVGRKGADERVCSVAAQVEAALQQTRQA
jgi:amidase